MEQVTESRYSVRVRFAPSPTGFLHVGGARTAIFNWLFAKNQGGKFLLRIEDTDMERSKSELSRQIIRSLSWLGMESDEPIVFQSDRIKRYKEIVYKLVDMKKAYYSFETQEQLDEKRKEAKEKKLPYKYDRASLKLSEETIKNYLNEGMDYTIRFFVPDGITEFDDLIHGRTVFDNSEIADFVILRSDGSPVYQIAVVVDDRDMNITHVIRGDDHLSNTPKQILLYKSLEWNIPKFAHLPMILDEGKKKLSKRRDTVAVEEYKDKGYLADALFNFLTLLGFAPDNNAEIITKEELVKIFSLERVNKKSAVFDINKLNWMNSEYIKMADESVLAQIVKEKLEERFFARSPAKQDDEAIPRKETKDKEFALFPDAVLSNIDYIKNVIKLMKERVSTLNDFIEFGRYFFTEPDSYDEKGLMKYWNQEAKEIMKEYLETLVIPSEGENEFSAGKLEEQLRIFATSKNIKTAKIIHPLRLALTGLTIGPGLFELMEVLGKESVLKRLQRFINIEF